jgi:hypothetical protein
MLPIYLELIPVVEICGIEKEMGFANYAGFR